MIAIETEIPKNCVECEENGIRLVNHCQLIFDGKADIERHPNCPLKEIVICKECEHSMEIAKASKRNELTMILACRKFEMGVTNNFSCADGERRK